MGGKGAKENASAKALIENMKPALMWIAGKKDAFTDKTHHFFSGEKIQKQIVAINDLRKEANYNFDWKIVVADNAYGIIAYKAAATINVSDAFVFELNGENSYAVQVAKSGKKPTINSTSALKTFERN